MSNSIAAGLHPGFGYVPLKVGEASQLWSPINGTASHWFSGDSAEYSSSVLTAWNDKIGQAAFSRDVGSTPDGPSQGTINGVTAVFFDQDWVSGGNITDVRAVILSLNNIDSNFPAVGPIVSNAAADLHTFIRDQSLNDYDVSVDGGLNISGSVAVDGGDLVSGTNIDIPDFSWSFGASTFGTHILYAQYESAIVIDNVAYLQVGPIYKLIGNISDLVIWDAVPNIEERQKAEGWLANKIGANLPNDHPYKNNPPTA